MHRAVVLLLACRLMVAEAQDGSGLSNVVTAVTTEIMNTPTVDPGVTAPTPTEPLPNTTPIPDTTPLPGTTPLPNTTPLPGTDPTVTPTIGEVSPPGTPTDIVIGTPTTTPSGIVENTPTPTPTPNGSGTPTDTVATDTTTPEGPAVTPVTPSGSFGFAGPLPPATTSGAGSGGGETTTSTPIPAVSETPDNIAATDTGAATTKSSTTETGTANPPPEQTTEADDSGTPTPTAQNPTATTPATPIDGAATTTETNNTAAGGTTTANPDTTTAANPSATTATNSNTPAVATPSTSVATLDVNTSAFTAAIAGLTQASVAGAPQASSTVAPEFIETKNVQEADIPHVELNKAEIGDVGAYEVDIYAQWIAAGNMLAHEDDSGQARPPTLPICPSTKGTTGRHKRQTASAAFGCSPASIEVLVHFVHVTPGFYLTDEPLKAARQRAIRNLLFLRSVMAKLGIEITLASYDVRVDADFSNHRYVEGDLYAQADPVTKRNAKFMRGTRQGGADELTVWIVDECTDVRDGRTFAGYGFFPNAGKNGPLDWDGIVLKQAQLSPATGDATYKTTDEPSACASKPGKYDSLGGSALVHEFGHWMGLRHVSEGGCSGNDGVADTNQIADGDDKAGGRCCYQKRCGTGSVFQVKNWMSFSSCRGVDLTGKGAFNTASFTDGQRARMFTHFLKFRQKKACDAPLRLSQRSSPGTAEEGLLRRQAGQGQGKAAATLLADLLLNNCSVAIQDVFQQGSIPIDPKVLAGYSSAAAALQLNPPATSAGGPDRPMTIQAAKGEQPTDSLPEAVFNTGTASSTGGAAAPFGRDPGSQGGRTGLVATVLGAVIWAVFGVYI